MKKIIFVVFVSVLFISLVGCGKKQQPMAEMQEPISIEDIDKISASEQTLIAPAISTSPSSTYQGELEPLPPSGPYKPTTGEIQTALKNAGYYTGLIDGKIGPLTKKAIEEFQKASALKVDGKVGPNTWALLSNYLNPAPVSSKRARKR